MASIVVNGDTSGSITLSAPAVSGSSVLTLPAVTDTVAGIAATQTLTNKTLTSPTLTTPALGTPASGILTSCTGVQYDGFKNRIINGAMVIDQRNAGASVTPTANAYTLDRWYFYVSQSSKLTSQQNAGAVTPAVGFSNYLGVTSSSAYAITASDNFVIAQRAEGFNTFDLAWGTANAATVTLSFRVYSSLTGTFGGAIQNSAQARSYPFTYSVPVANTWTSISETIAGDTSGTWIGATNGTGLILNFGLGVGSNQSGSASSWQAGNITSATGATSVVGTNGATFYITGVQLEKGSTATSFDYRPIGTELQLCQRYYESQYFSNSTMGGSGQFIALGLCETTSRIQPYYPFKVQKRAAPSTSLSAISTFGIRSTSSSFVCTSGSFGASNTTYANGEFNNGGGGLIAGGAGWLTNHDGNAKIEWSAEL